MRVMVIVKASSESEAGVMPSTEALAAMGAYNEELVKAGIMLAGEGLHDSSQGKRVRLGLGEPTVVDGPFAAAPEELVAGFWIWQVDSMDQAIEWARRCPTDPGIESVLELRPIFEAEDFGAEFTPELRAQEERTRELAAALQH